MKYMITLFIIFFQVHSNPLFAQFSVIPLFQYDPEKCQLTGQTSLYINYDNYFNNKNSLKNLYDSFYLLRSFDFSDNNKNKPPLKSGKILAQFGIGLLVGFASNVFAANLYTENTKVEGDWEYNPDRHTMMFVCSIIGTSLGIYSIGNIGESEGSYFSIFLGTIIGSIPLLIPLLSEDPYYGFHAISYGLLLQTIGGIIAFNLSRRYDDDSVSSMGLINVKNKRISLAIPIFAFNKHYYDFSEIKIIQLNL